jgi:hypothetical protein
MLQQAHHCAKIPRKTYSWITLWQHVGAMILDVRFREGRIYETS